MEAVFMSEFLPLYLVAMLHVAGQIVYDLTKRLLRGCCCMIRGLPIMCQFGRAGILPVSTSLEEKMSLLGVTCSTSRARCPRYISVDSVWVS